MYRHYDLKMSCTNYIFIIYTFLTVLYTYEIKKPKKPQINFTVKFTIKFIIPQFIVCHSNNKYQIIYSMIKILKH